MSSARKRSRSPSQVIDLKWLLIEQPKCARGRAFDKAFDNGHHLFAVLGRLNPAIPAAAEELALI